MDITFSGIIDTCVTQSGRPAEKESIIRYTNDTLRKIQQGQLYQNDLVILDLTDLVTIETVSGMQQAFEFTKPNLFRRIQALQYTNNLGHDCFPVVLRPSAAIRSTDDYYYASGNKLTVVGKYGINSPVLAYYAYLPYYAYYAVGTRPAICDENFVWQYLKDGAYVDALDTAEEEEAARALVSNWLTASYNHTVISGALFKLYAQLDMASKNAIEYSIYKSGLSAITDNEVYVGNVS